MILPSPERYMTVPKINGTSTCSTPHIFVYTSPAQKSLRSHQISAIRKAPLRYHRHPSVLFLQSLRIVMICHLTLTRSDERTPRTKKTKLNNFFPPSHPGGDRSLLNERVPNLGSPPVGYLHQRFSPNLHWSPFRNYRIPIWKS